MTPPQKKKNVGGAKNSHLASFKDLAKIEELSKQHGPIVAELFGNGRTPMRAVGNFYGRALPRQTAIHWEPSMDCNVARC
jgi:hypothetical protein